MAFNFTTTSEYIEKSPLEDKTDLLNGLHEAQEAYQELLRANVEMDSTEAMLVDIQEALATISAEYVGPESLEMFNTSGTFQALYDEPIEDLTRVEAMEGLGDALKAVWNKLIAWIKDIFEAIWKFIKSLLFLGPRASKKADKVIAATKEPEAKEAIQETEVPAEVMTPEQVAENTTATEQAAAEMAAQVQTQAEIESAVTKATELAKQGKEEEANKLLEGLVAKVEENSKKLDSLTAKVEELNKPKNDKKETLSAKGYSPDTVAKAAGQIKKAATADAQKLAKDAEALKARNEKIRRYIVNTALVLIVPEVGLAKIGYDAANAKYKKEHDGKSLAEAGKEKVKAGLSEGKKKFGDLCRKLMTSTAKAPGKICSMFSKLRKKQEQTLNSFETVLTPVTKEEIEQADAHNINEALKKKQEEMGLETESFNIDLESVEGFMDLVKSVANKVKSGFASTLKKITDITTRGVAAAEKAPWQHVLGLNNPNSNENDKILNFKQADHLLNTTIPSIVEDAKKVIPVYNKSKPVDDLPSTDEFKKITDDITSHTDYTVNYNQFYGPTGDGNTGCDWGESHSKAFASQYIRKAKEGLPQEIIKMTSNENNADTSAEVTRSIAAARWLVKAYGKCLAEISKTVIKLADTCGLTEEARRYQQM